MSYLSGTAVVRCNRPIVKADFPGKGDSAMLTLFPGLDEKCTSSPSQVPQAAWLSVDLPPAVWADSSEIHDSHGVPHIDMSLDSEIILNRNNALGTCWCTTRGHGVLLFQFETGAFTLHCFLRLIRFCRLRFLRRINSIPKSQSGTANM